MKLFMPLSCVPEIAEVTGRICGRRHDILRTVELGYSNARHEELNTRIRATIRHS